MQPTRGTSVVSEAGSGGSRRRSRRRRAVAMLGAAFLLLFAFVLTACGGDGDNDGAKEGGKSGRVVVADYGGVTREYIRASMLNPFSKESGMESVSADASLGKLKLFAERGRADWDLVDTDGWDVYSFAQEGLLTKLPEDVERGDLIPEAYRDYTPWGYNVSWGIGYQKKEGKPEPKSWADFFDTKKFPGKRGLWNAPFMAVQAALLADGVNCEDLYPLDFDRAFKKLDTIRDDVLFYESFGQGVQFLAQGSVEMVLISNGRVQVLKDQGLPMDFVWNQAINQWSVFAIPKDAPNPDSVAALAKFMSQPEGQAQFAKLSAYGPPSSAALDLLDEESLAKLPNAPEHRELACPINDIAHAEQQDEYVKRFNAWLAKN